jgi:hypothetical protein
MKTVKTPKGTELPLLNLKGKDYLQVAHRLVWMREEHPDWGIETEFLELKENIAIARATIRDASGRILAQGTKSETPNGFADYIEKAESGSIGRALAMCGFGTQFTEDLDEGGRIVDSPQTPRNNNARPPQSPQDASSPSAATGNPSLVSEKQIGLLMMKAKTANMSDAALKDLLGKRGYTSRKLIPKAEFNDILKEVESWRAQ